MYYNYAGITPEIGLGGARHCLSWTQLQAVPGFVDERGAWEDYHVYSVEWRPGAYYRVRIDGVLVKSFVGEEYASGRSTFLVLSNLISDGASVYGGPASQKQVTWKNKPYRPGDAFLTQGDRSAMKVDWVRVWIEEPAPGG